MSKSNAILQNSGAERAILSGIISYGSECLFEIEEILSTKDFYWEYNQKIYKILLELAHQKQINKFDLPSIQTVANELGYSDLLEDKKKEYLQTICNYNNLSQDNIKLLAINIYKLSLARNGYLVAAKIQKELKNVTGTEKIEDIIAKIEQPIFDFTQKITNSEKSITKLGCDISSTIEALIDNETKDIVGLSTGFPLWDMAIGGGFRPGTINVLGARPKIGKSLFCLGIAYHLAKHNVPVLYLDTELTNEIQLLRLTSLVSGVDLARVENGQFKNIPQEKKSVLDCKKQIEQLPIDYCSIAGQNTSAILSMMRRWLYQKVKFNDIGSANPCLIIYDYIKLMDSTELRAGGLQEYQLIGFLLTHLHNFAVNYKLPIFATIQLNREGVSKEDDTAIATSDRVLWLCSNFTILKPKRKSDLADDPPLNGTKKLVVINTRFGPGIMQGDYINIIDQLDVARLKEGNTFSHNVSL